MTTQPSTIVNWRRRSNDLKAEIARIEGRLRDLRREQRHAEKQALLQENGQRDIFEDDK